MDDKNPNKEEEMSWTTRIQTKKKKCHGRQESKQRRRNVMDDKNPNKDEEMSWTTRIQRENSEES